MENAITAGVVLPVGKDIHPRIVQVKVLEERLMYPQVELLVTLLRHACLLGDGICGFSDHPEGLNGVFNLRRVP